MGKRGPLPKPRARAQGHRARPDGLALVRAGEVEIPPLHKDALVATRRAWQTYWTSDLARSAAPTDLPVLRRLFKLYDQHARAQRIVDRALIVKGSMGQIRVNPLADYVLKLEGHILRLENELGLTPAARARLNIDFTTAIKSLEELNRDLDDDADEAFDPRSALHVADHDG